MEIGEICRGSRVSEVPSSIDRLGRDQIFRKRTLDETWRALMAGPRICTQSFQRRRPRRVSRLFTALVEGGPGTRRARHSTWQVSRSGGWRDQAAHCDDPCRMDVKGSLRRVPRRYKHCGLASAPREGCLRLHLASFRQARRPATDSQITSGQTSTGSLCGWGPCVRCRPIARNLTDLTSGSQLPP
jgi:hypothetical protein